MNLVVAAIGGNALKADDGVGAPPTARAAWKR